MKPPEQLTCESAGKRAAQKRVAQGGSNRITDKDYLILTIFPPATV